MIKSLNDSQIRPKKVLGRIFTAYKNDIKILRSQRLVYVKCSACGFSKNHLFLSKMKFNFVSCNRCNTIFLNPRPTENSLEKFYTNSKSMKMWEDLFKKSEQIRKEKIFKPRIQKIKKILQSYKMNNCNTLLEVGAGYGWFCQMAKQTNLAKKIIAIEPSSTFSKKCRKIKNIEVIESTIEKTDPRIQADVIVSFEVISHIFDPKLFLKSSYSRLRPGGLLIFTIPNGEGIDIQILKEHEDHFFPHVMTLFNPKSITYLLKQLHFRNVDVSTPGLMDLHVIMNKLQDEELDLDNFPFFKFLMKNQTDEFIDELQILIQKHKLSSHMFVVAQK